MTQENKTGERPPRGKPFVKGRKKMGGRKKGTPNLMKTDEILAAAALLGDKEKWWDISARSPPTTRTRFVKSWPECYRSEPGPSGGSSSKRSSIG